MRSTTSTAMSQSVGARRLVKLAAGRVNDEQAGQLDDGLQASCRPSVCAWSGPAACRTGSAVAPICCVIPLAPDLARWCRILSSKAINLCPCPCPRTLRNRRAQVAVWVLVVGGTAAPPVLPSLPSPSRPLPSPCSSASSSSSSVSRRQTPCVVLSLQLAQWPAALLPVLESCPTRKRFSGL